MAVEKKPTAGSPLFGTFPSDRIPKATKDGKVHFFRQSFTFRDGIMMDKAWQSKHVDYTNSGNVLKVLRVSNADKNKLLGLLHLISSS
jgi:hypothetical protein